MGPYAQIRQYHTLGRFMIPNMVSAMSIESPSVEQRSCEPQKYSQK